MKLLVASLLIAIVLYIAGDFEFGYSIDPAGNYRVDISYTLTMDIQQTLFLK